MRYWLASLLPFLCLVNVAHAAPADEKTWLACDTDSECTSVELGCTYWRAVNKKSVNLLYAKYPSASCLKSSIPGPKPISICMHHICVDDYAVSQWKLFTTYDKIHRIDTKISACLSDAGIDVNVIRGPAYASLREPYQHTVEDLISKGAFADDTPLATIIDPAIQCDEVVAKAKILKR